MIPAITWYLEDKRLCNLGTIWAHAFCPEGKQQQIVRHGDIRKDCATLGHWDRLYIVGTNEHFWGLCNIGTCVKEDCTLLVQFEDCAILGHVFKKIVHCEAPSKLYKVSNLLHLRNLIIRHNKILNSYLAMHFWDQIAYFWGQITTKLYIPGNHRLFILVPDCTFLVPSVFGLRHIIKLNPPHTEHKILQCEVFGSHIVQLFGPDCTILDRTLRNPVCWTSGLSLNQNF